jgi:nucleotide-binding universal stress UspA family protein
MTHVLIAVDDYDTSVDTHERGWFRRLFASSVSDAVIREAEIPVLVAR